MEVYSEFGIGGLCRNVFQLLPAHLRTMADSDNVKNLILITANDLIMTSHLTG